MPSFAQTLLHTERLLLRPLREADAAALLAIFSDPRVTRYLSRPAWTSITVAHERIARDIAAMSAGTYVCFGIERRSDGQLLGECTLFNLNEQCRRAEIGYTMAFDAWGQGYMNEALCCLLDFGFSQLALNRVEADIEPRNLASAKSLERLGFIKEGHLRQRWIVAGEVSDSGLYGLLASDWKASVHRRR
jgi:[ribosomal protein S5]-alanine N-acetyltransferase